MRSSWMLIALLFGPLHGDPWGKDADLAQKNEPSLESCRPLSPLAAFGKRAIRFHQEVISPADGPRSHYKPSSSQYTLEAISSYGFFQGFLLGCDRLMRENSEMWIYPTVEGEFGPLKYDPVPRPSAFQARNPLNPPH